MANINGTEGGGCSKCRLALPVKETFDLEKAVCSYGFFMMAPNIWFPSTRTLQRPLRLRDERSVMVCISQDRSTSSSSFSSPNLLIRVRVLGVETLTNEDEQYLLAQVCRMLRLSETEDSAISGFHALHPEARAKGFGRLFRSPTLFEDMVKGILLCNCGWGRTLAMVKLLCDLQSELKGQPLGVSTVQSISVEKLGIGRTSVEVINSGNRGKISKKEGKLGKDKLGPEKLEKIRKMRQPEKLRKNQKNVEKLETIATLQSTTSIGKATVSQTSDIRSIVFRKNSGDLEQQKCTEDYCQPSNLPDLGSSPESQSLEGCGQGLMFSSGDFPTPSELANLDETFLAKRCGLGYRAKRILKLAGDICKGTTDLSSLESSNGSTQTGMCFDDLKEHLLKLDGFGPFTCANVLMCMGDYRSIPADSETVRHLKQVHGRFQCTTGTVGREVEDVYAKYAPFQFLAYWFEIWNCYEKKFGRLSQMPPSNYHLITGNNMRRKVSKYFMNT